MSYFPTVVYLTVFGIYGLPAQYKYVLLFSDNKKCQAVISYVTIDTLLFRGKGVYYCWMPAYAPD